MNIAVIFAGGTGQRMNTKTKPKQFLELHGKPILVYTLEKYQQHEEISGIILVCVDGWIGYCENLIDRYRLTKVKAIVKGGETGQASIYNGLLEAEKFYPKESVVLIHDGVRPLIDEKTISQAIACVKEKGSAITVSPAIETVVIKGDNDKVEQILDRKSCQHAKAPQCFILKDILDAHKKAMQDKRNDFIDSAFLMQFYGYELHTVEGTAENIKITTPSDYYMFRAIVDARENSEIFGI